MNRFFTLLLAASCLTAFGQTEYPYPYNPDGNNDGYISLNDLLDLLSVYGSEFNAGILATDSISAVYYTGELDYYDCASSCVALRGNWKMLDKDLVGSYKPLLSNQSESAWLDVRNAPLRYSGSSAYSSYVSTSSWGTTGTQTQYLNGCFCQTRTRADIEDINVCEGLEDECGVCNGEGAIYECGCSDIPEGDCDCEGNQLDAIGVCGGDCIEDADGDGICDPVLGPCEGQDYVTYHGYDYEIVETADGRCWFGEDLRTHHFNDGSSIPTNWDSANLNMWNAFVDFIEPALLEIEGGYKVFYNGGVVFTEKQSCPVGWRVPSQLEWSTLAGAYSLSPENFLELCGSEYTYNYILPYPTNGNAGINLEERGYATHLNANGYVFQSWAQYWTTDLSTGNSPLIAVFDFSGGNPNAAFSNPPLWEGRAIRCIKDSE